MNKNLRPTFRKNVFTLIELLHKCLSTRLLRLNSAQVRATIIQFTLIELLVVIAIIGILASLLLPALSTARQMSYMAVCAANQKQIYTAAICYGTDYNGYLSGGGGHWGDEAGQSINYNQGGVMWWANNYLGIKFYKYGTNTQLVESDYTTNATAVGHFKSGSSADKGVFRCPGAKYKNGDPKLYGYDTSSTDYILAGLGASGRNAYSDSKPELVYNYPRMMRAACADNSFIFDNCQSNINLDWRAYYFNEANNHNPSKPQGMNFCDGSGAVKWMPITNTFTFPTVNATGYHCIPKGYITQFNGQGNIGYSASMEEAFVYDKNGGYHTDAEYTNKFY